MRVELLSWFAIASSGFTQTGGNQYIPAARNPPMRKPIPPPFPHALACGLLEDSGRALFLARTDKLGRETLELPCVLLQKGENPVAALSAAFRNQAGIDAQIHEVMFERRLNFGSRKRKTRIPALVFKATAKRAEAKPATGFSGFRWISSTDLPKHRLARICEWLR